MPRVSTFELRRRVRTPRLCEFNVFDTSGKIKAEAWVRRRMQDCIDALDFRIGKASGVRPDVTLKPVVSHTNLAVAVCRATKSKEWK